MTRHSAERNEKVQDLPLQASGKAQKNVKKDLYM